MANKLEGDELRTDLEALEAQIQELGAEKVLAVVSTASCFAPRAPDRLVEIAELCAKHQIGHLINNAYGVQAASTTQLIGNAIRKGRVDVVLPIFRALAHPVWQIVQSTDKNFMVPVGGAILAAPSGSKELLDQISAAYPGRASMAPVLDLFVTLLSMGADGFTQLLQQRKTVFKQLQAGLEQLAERHGERVLDTRHNPISFAMTLGGFCANAEERQGITFLGAMLFARNCSGARVVSGVESKKVGPLAFEGFGAHCDLYPTPYMNAAAAIGMTQEDVVEFLSRLDTALTELAKKKAKERKAQDCEESAEAAPEGAQSEQ